MKKLLKVLLGTSLYLLERSDRATKHARAHLGDHLDDLRDLTKRKYDAAADRVEEASKDLRGESHAIRNTLRFAVGVGVGVGVALLTAPSSGEETRTLLAGKAQKLGDDVRKRFSSHEQEASAAAD